MFILLKISPQFDVHNQTPAEQWSKKPRLTNRVKATDIFKSDPRKPQAQKERRTYGTMQNLKFHGEQTRACSHRRVLSKHLSRLKAQHHVTPVEDPPHQKKQPLNRGQEMLQSFSSEFVQGSSQNVMADDEMVSFRPEFASTPCAEKKHSTPRPKKSTMPRDTAKPNCHLDVCIPDPSPNGFRWCDNVFGVQPIRHQCIRSMVAEKPVSPLKTSDLQPQGIDAIQVSFEKLLVEHNDPEHIESATNKVDDKSLSVLASDTLIHNGDYIMPYCRPTT